MKIIELTRLESPNGTYFLRSSELFRLLLCSGPGFLDGSSFSDGLCALIPPGQSCTLIAESAKAPLELSFSPELLPPSLLSAQDALQRLDSPAPEYAAYILSYCQLLSTQPGLSGTAPESGLAALLSWFSLFSARASAVSSHTQSLADQAKQIIQAEYMSDLTLQSVAARLFVNPCYLSTVFHQSVGTTFRAYLRDVRLEQTCRLLSETNAMITDIAMQTGFNSTAYLISSFRKAYGITPNAYRNRLSRQ